MNWLKCGMMTLSQRLKQGFVHLTYMIFFFFHQPKSTFVARLCISVQDTHDLASHCWPTLLIPVAVPASLWSFTQLEFTGSTLGCHHPTEIREQSPFQLQGIGSKCVLTRPDSRAYDLCNCLGSPAQKDPVIIFKFWISKQEDHLSTLHWILQIT